jgi:retron-type reverse transcriptase
MDKNRIKGARVSPIVEGTPQGGPLSSPLSNLLLDELDRALIRKKFPVPISFCFFGDGRRLR